jgi:arylsulfatase A
VKARLGFILLAVYAFAHAAEPAKPNILLLYADDLGYGDLRAYNPDSKIPTPNLDRLAAEGLRFTDGHSSSAICTPSRYAMLTGRHHWRDFHGISDSFGGSVFKPERLTLPEMLQAHGYATAAIGKWHLGWGWDAIKKPNAQPREAGKAKIWGPDAFDWSKPIPDGPLAHGFDYYFGDDVINFPPYTWIENDRVLAAPDTMLDTKAFKPVKEGGWESRNGPMVTGWDPYKNIPELTRRGIDYIHSRKGAKEPFFLYFAYPSPHAPIIPNDEFDGKSAAGPYGDSLCETDDSIGKLLGALDEAGLTENTLVIFSSDNGPEWYAYPRDKKFGHWSSHPLRGAKRDLYEGGHRVPFLIKWPGVTSPGRVSDALVSQIDLMATIASAIDYSLPANAAEDSHDLLPLLRAEVAPIRTTHVHNTYEKAWAIRHGDWLLIEAKSGYTSTRDAGWEARHGYPADDGLPVELFNVRDDLAQKRNLAAENPERVAALGALLKKIRTQGHSAPRLASTTLTMKAPNPIVRHLFTADPSARVFDGRLHVYTSHDRDDAVGYDMVDWWLFSTDDLVTWKDHGAVFKLTGFAWAEKQAWAPDAIAANGKYYLFLPTDRSKIGVAVSDKPDGPFVDAIGAPLIDNATMPEAGVEPIDPAILVDDDGTTWLYFGCRQIMVAKLDPSLTKLSGPLRKVVILTSSGEPAPQALPGKDPQLPAGYGEGPSMFKRDGRYYLVYSNGWAHGTTLVYATSDSPTGPFTYQGPVMHPVACSTHHGMVGEFKGKWYVFYHTAEVSGGNGYRRSVCVDELTFAPDGQIIPVTATSGLTSSR